MGILRIIERWRIILLFIICPFTFSACLEPFANFQRSASKPFRKPPNATIQAFPVTDDRILLSKNLIKEYEITDTQLESVFVYYGSEIVFRFVDINRDKAIANNRLFLTKTDKTRNVKLRKDVPGRITSFFIEYDAIRLENVKKFKVVFDNPAEGLGRLELTFGPDFDGNYALEDSWFFEDKITYQGNKYLCISGCNNNYLYAPGKEIQIQVRDRRRK